MYAVSTWLYLSEGIFSPVMAGPPHSPELLILNGLIALGVPLQYMEEGYPLLSVLSSIHKSLSIVLTEYNMFCEWGEGG